MRARQLSFGAAALAGCAGAALLRRWQRATAFDAEGYLTPGMPATWCFVGFLALAAAALFFLARAAAKEVRGTTRSYLAAFSIADRKWVFVFYLLAGALLVAAGALEVTAQAGQEEVFLGRRVLSVLLAPTGLDMALVGWVNLQREEGRGRFAWPLLIPGYCGCVWIIMAYQSQSFRHTPMAYGPYLLAVLCAAVAAYRFAAFSFERDRTALTLWASAVAAALLAVAGPELWREGDRAAALMCGGWWLYVSAQMWVMLGRLSRPAALEPWTAPADERDENDTEVSEHE